MTAVITIIITKNDEQNQLANLMLILLKHVSEINSSVLIDAMLQDVFRCRHTTWQVIGVSSGQRIKHQVESNKKKLIGYTTRIYCKAGYCPLSWRYLYVSIFVLLSKDHFISQFYNSGRNHRAMQIVIWRCSFQEDFQLLQRYTFIQLKVISKK